jgi:hypothetical protein
MVKSKLLERQEETEMKTTETNTLRKDLTEEQKAQALRIGRIGFKSAGATRKR